MLQNYLVKHNIPYVFTQVDNSLFEFNGKIDNTLTALRDDIDMTKFITNEEGMFNWAKRTKQQFYTTHPHESAHKIWLDQILLQSDLLHKYII